MKKAEGYGTLYLLPVWLGEHGGVEQLPPENIALVQRITLYFTEHEKTARHMLRRMVPSIELPALELHRLDKDTTFCRKLTAPLASTLLGASASRRVNSG